MVVVGGTAEEQLATILAQEIAEREEVELARQHPGLLLRHVYCVDNTTGDEFEFFFTEEQIGRWSAGLNWAEDDEHVLPDYRTDELWQPLFASGEITGWEWQGDLLDWWLGNKKTVILKARQIGITWCAAGLALWYLLYKPGTKVLIQSKTEDDAADVVDHIWEMYLSLKERKPHLLNGTKVLKPAREGARPHLNIEVEHPAEKGRPPKISIINAMASTAGAGHGQTAALVILDEYSRHPYAREAWKAVVPAQSGRKRSRPDAITGRTIVISTGNGVSSTDGGGNFYHHLYINWKKYGIRKLFLRWDRNPERDEQWYREEAMSMPDEDRAEQFPRNEREAFLLTGRPYFHVKSLTAYEDLVPETWCQGRFNPLTPSIAELEELDVSDPETTLTVWHPPDPNEKYAIGADSSTGKGKDYSAAYVINLGRMRIEAEIHGLLDADVFAQQLYFLGRWYNGALIAVENQGGYGTAVIVPLRDGKDGRRPYKRLYIHVRQDSIDKEPRRDWGFPMSSKTRPQVLEHAQAVMREQELPFVPPFLLEECRTFVKKDTMPSPRAEDGCNDDRVMAFAVTLEMFRQKGHHPDKWKPGKKPQRRRPVGINDDGTVDDDARYPGG